MRWKDIETRAEKEGVPAKMILREEIQKGILTSFSKEGGFQTMVFQGGTALRLFHNNPRYSEDLDFVVREGEGIIDLDTYMDKAAGFVAYSYPFLESVETHRQKAEEDFRRSRLKTVSEDPEQRVRINVELFDVPSYMNEARILSYPPINPAVRVERPEEILADKVTALSGREYIKGRDIWDIYFLTEQKDMDIDLSLVSKKIQDYGMEGKGFISELKKANTRLKEEGKNILERELKRFLPASLYQYYEKELDTIIGGVLRLTEEVIKKYSSVGRST